ncbi:tRNA (5-methylaminomethyl-2-thiouridine)(34)-methyltransferase MnmD [Nitratiruptor sp. YY09-18]|uniref:tRNA (5-methylaminomethyl-2-thiouridine)(34)-methyltransferase MnmD n=1 Tax=Nitratiruptor sp. YY09-18 TaxID=2724901 RepID=UPI00191582AB|nr:MnmC family methyltransferase [Nitratiruptor sp. YY09-18]BCD68726.1 hypothetical protein NitYY0918_C1643 [Nitratiruptor sp. YY09-18]
MYEIRQSNDGSLTLYSHEFDECYHSTKDGALTEALQKHVIPAFTFCSKPHLRILDICFGLGINTLATLYHFFHQDRVKSIEIFSPELDRNLLQLLPDFTYPEQLAPYKEILLELLRTKRFQSDNITIELFIGNARAYIKSLHAIDVVYQDAFSPKKNPILWTVEYFTDIAKLLTDDGILTTYSQATPVRLALHEVGLKVYELKLGSLKPMTIASKKELPLRRIDMETKKMRSCAKPIKDEDIETL